MSSRSSSHRPVHIPVPAHGRIGRYELIERIATGGMAEIYLAQEVSGLDRLVVIKRILPHLAEHDSFVEMFLQEARFVSRLSHPNVVQIYELGETASSSGKGTPFIAMEYVPGVSLRELMRTAALSEAPIPIGVALGLITQACAGAHAAHELTGPEGQPLGLVHRDISPHNLMVTGDGHVKLLDFGIAKATEIAAEQTRTGALKGKVHYMSPEQCQQSQLDRRSDVFALGIVLWELLTARRLFKRDSELASMQAIVTGDRWLASEFREGLSDVISRAVDKSLEVKPGDRYASADEMRRALAAAAEKDGVAVSADVIAPFLKDVVGERLETTRQHLVDLADRTRSDGDFARPAPGDGASEDEEIVDGEETLVDRSRAKQAALRAELEGEPAAGMTLTGSETGVTSLKMAVKKRSRGLFAAALATLLIGAVAAVLVVTEPWKPALTGPPLVLGFAPIIDKNVLRTEMEPLRVYLEEATRRPMKLVVTDSYDELGELLVNGGVHFASMPPNLYVQSKKREPGLEVLAFKLYDGASGSDGYLVVREDAKVSSVAQLKGRTLCFGDETSTTGYLLPRSALRKAGLDPDVDIETYRSGNHMQVLRDLLAGRCDVGGVYSGVYQTAPQSGVPTAQLRILAVTGRVPQDGITAGPRTPEADRRLVQEALLAFDPKVHLGTSDLGQLEKISGFAKGSDGEYSSIRRVLEEEAAAGKPLPADEPRQDSGP